MIFERRFFFLKFIFIYIFSFSLSFCMFVFEQTRLSIYFLLLPGNWRQNLNHAQYFESVLRRLEVLPMHEEVLRGSVFCGLPKLATKSTCRYTLTAPDSERRGGSCWTRARRKEQVLLTEWEMMIPDEQRSEKEREKTEAEKEKEEWQIDKDRHKLKGIPGRLKKWWFLFIQTSSYKRSGPLY